MSIFSKVAFKKPKESRFKMDHDFKLSFKMGDLIPVLCEETLPGDRWRLSTQQLLRMAPMIAPVMHKVDVYVHHFFVANRIVFPEWNEFIYQTKPGYVAPEWPYITDVNSDAGRLANYLGMPAQYSPAGTKINALPFAAALKVWNDYFRDENLEPDLTEQCTLTPGNNNGVDGAKRTDLTVIRRRAWQKDYFTSALPWAQKGDAVTLPLASDFPDVSVEYNDLGIAGKFTTPGAGGVSGPQPVAANMDGASPDSAGDAKVNVGGIYYDAAYDPNGTLKALTSELELESTTIENLRVSMLLQEWLEKSARGGTRNNEGSLVHFGVRSSDGRLQRPDYLGGSMNPMVISEVLQTSESLTTPQGNMAGHGLSAGSGSFINYFCEEHGWMISFISILPKTAYQQGLHKKFFRQDRFDYAWPTFANLGEQPVYNKEIFLDDDEDNDEIFGYQSRYAEYKHIQSRVAGDFCDNLSYWHMGRIFESRPHLNGAFVAADPTTRVFAVEDPSIDKIYAHVFHRCSVTRKLPYFGVPVSLR